MNTRCFFDSEEIFGIGFNTVLRRFQDDYKNEYLSMRNAFIEMPNYIRKVDYPDMLWQFVMKLESDNLYLAITDKESGAFIGYATIGNLDSDDQEIGLSIIKEYRNKGYGTDTVRVLLSTAKRILQKNSYLLRIYDDNIPSLTLFKKFNISKVGEESSEYIQMLEEIRERLPSPPDSIKELTLFDEERYNQEAERTIGVYRIYA